VPNGDGISLSYFDKISSVDMVRTGVVRVGEATPHTFLVGSEGLRSLAGLSRFAALTSFSTGCSL
jgi:hypothetical protein